MLGLLTEKMQGLVSKLTPKKTLTEANISDSVNEVRLALLEADVNYSVAKVLVQRIKEKALGDAVLKSVSPGQQFIKIVHDELTALMGGEESPLNLTQKPAVIMLCGLQGSGKTTHSVKVARYLQKQKLAKKPLIAACDLQRPAAIQQLHTLAKQADIPVFSLENEKDPRRVATAALEQARNEHHDVLILDTAGRLHVDEELMAEVKAIRDLTQPSEILFVANATTGQDAVNSATAFNTHLSITGTILTMLDGNTRGGAAISIREVTGKPLKFEGIGEKIDDIQLFNPTSMSDRILGMGDTINLVRKAEEHFSEEEAQSLEKKLRDATFTFDDYLSQIQMVRKMGSLKGLLSMMPGIGQAMGKMNIDDKEFFKVEAIIQSMTPQERSGKDELIIPRRKRIARGSGTKPDDVNRLVKSFGQAKKFMKNMPKNQKHIEKMMGGTPWR